MTPGADGGKPLLIGIGGPSGAGKTTAALGLAKRLASASTVIDADRVWLDASGGRDGGPLRSREMEGGILKSALVLLSLRMETALGQGGIVIVPWSFGSPAMRSLAEDCAARQGAVFKGFHLTAPASTRARRAASRNRRWELGRPEPDNWSAALPSRSDPALAQQVLPAHWTVIDATRSREAVVAQIAAGLVDVTLPGGKPVDKPSIVPLSRPAGSATRGRRLST